MNSDAVLTKNRLVRISLRIATIGLACVVFGWPGSMAPTKVEAAGLGEQRVPHDGSPAVGQFIQIPGPNPILRPGPKGTWDGGVIEAGNVLKDEHTYYFYYHGTPGKTEKWPRDGYRIGVATADHLLGPWKKNEGDPLLDLGAIGSWEDQHVACPSVIKEAKDKWYMWYCGRGHDRKNQPWSIGLATASSPLGPWKKYEGNPVVEDFGYVGGVVKVGGKYYMYSVWPVGSTSPDQGAIYVATADKPEGPWKKYVDKPVVPNGDWGAWDDGGYSEAGMLHHDGVFQTFYSGTKWRKLESIGYAYSYDGFNFTKYPGNPVAPRENNPDASAFAEIHAYWESPFYYLFHTLRNISRRGEDLGVQVLATRTPFSLTMPVINLASLEAGKSTTLGDSPPISVGNITRLALTVECTYSQSAKQAVKVHVRSSPDGLNYDTVDLLNFENALDPGQTARKTVELESKFKFVKVLVENPDRSQSVSDVKITATLGS
jgi:hypothetical protein